MWGKKKYEEWFKLNEDIMNEINGGRAKSWEVEQDCRPLYSQLSTMCYLYSIFSTSFLLQIILVYWRRWHYFLFVVVTGKKFILGRLISQNILKEADCASFSTSLGYPALLSRYLLQHGVQLMKQETFTAVKKLKISLNIFTLGKKVDLHIGRVPPPTPLVEDAKGSSLMVEE